MLQIVLTLYGEVLKGVVEKKKKFWVKEAIDKYIKILQKNSLSFSPFEENFLVAIWQPCPRRVKTFEHQIQIRFEL